MSSTLTNLTAATTWSGTDLFYALVGGNSRKIAASKFLVAETSSTLAMQDSTTAQTFRVYKTFTDSSNYERIGLKTTGTNCELIVETAGTGTDNLNLGLTAGGTGCVTIALAVTPTAGGAIDARIRLGATTGFGIYWGSNAPTLSAAKGSLYLRSDGASNVTRMYVNTDSAGTWTAVNTVA